MKPVRLSPVEKPMTHHARHRVTEGGCPPTRRVIVLGASNVTRGFPALVATAGRLWSEPLDVLGAFGHGRSYGTRRALLWRELPGIVECGLWEALNARPPLPAAALLTDVGNDLLYDAPVADILDWVATCVERLAGTGARVLLTPLPLCNMNRLSPGRFLLFRSILFPGCRLTYATVLARAYDLDAGLRDLARRQSIPLVEHRPEWYGLDPIHIRRGALVPAWLAMLSAVPDAPTRAGTAGMPWRQRWHLRRLTPECRWLFGREQRTPQPAGGLPDGTTVALY
jgi:hypothetical protein